MKRNFNSKFLKVFLVCTLLLSSLVATPVIAADSYPLTTSDVEVSDALNYLAAQQDTDGSIGDFSTSAWVTMAIAAAGEEPDDWKVDTNPSIVDYLATNAGSATSTTDYARMILAIVAASEDPTNFGGRDFVSLLNASYDGAQIGDSSLLNDDFWSVMALIAAGEDATSGIITNTVSFILSNQGGDGGWSWGVGQGSDVDDTAAAVMALIAAGEPAASQPIIDALAYIKSTQMDNGGFESWGLTNSATDSWGIDSIVAASQSPISADWTSGVGNGPVDDLLTFRNPDGSFNWTPDIPSNKGLMTAYAITALLGTPYPVATLESVEEGIPVAVRIEGQNGTIWSGEVTVSESTIIDDQGGEHYLAQPTALGALDEASQAGGFPYVVQDTAYGLYVYSINDEEPAGLAGWMYRVDCSSPWVGAADFILDETTPPPPPHQEILFTYSEWGQAPLKIEVDNAEPGVGEQFTVTVTQYSDDTNTWSSCESATVHADQNYTTGQDGTAAITIDTDMTVNIYAEKEGFIRSNRVTVTVGEGSTQPGDNENIGMAADIIPAISFSISPSSIDFGTLGPRDVSDPHTITLNNEGAWCLEITCTVTDEVAGLYEDGIKLDGTMWNLFSTILERSAGTNHGATLTVPEAYTMTGEQGGTLIFWAAETP